jgi:hypothetical protein
MAFEKHRQGSRTVSFSWYSSFFDARGIMFVYKNMISFPN